MSTIKQNSDFLFIYDATKCNPNGDPDQENKPRMDYDTKTNLVTDVRLKRYLRDYWKQENLEVFVDMEGDAKVSAENKLKAVVDRITANPDYINTVFANEPDLLKEYENILKGKKPNQSVFDALSGAKKEKEAMKVNLFLLDHLVHEQFLDIRLFGSAFAVAGFTRAYTGPVQINWGYSLHPVELMESNSLVTIMNDDNSTFGKDYRVQYSLLGFHGTINKHQAARTGMNEADRQHFRNAIWNAIPSLPTRTKQNQYPKVYIELVYNDTTHNGLLGDLRQHIQVGPKDGIDFKAVRGFNDLVLDFSQLKAQIHENKGPDKAIKEVIVKLAPGVSIDLDV